MKTSESVHRKQKTSDYGEQVPATDTHKANDFMQVSRTEHVDQSADIVLEETNSSAVNVTLDGSCGFLDLEEVASQPTEDRVHLGGDCSTKTVEYVVRDQQLAETATVAADISSPEGDAFDEKEGDTEMDISILDTPKFIIDQKSGCTTPASLISWNLDVGDTLSQDYDLFQDDENELPGDAELLSQSELKDRADECHNSDVEELPDRGIQSASLENKMKLQQSEKTQGRKEDNKEYVCTHSVSRCDVDIEDPVDDDVILQLDDEKMDSVDSASELASASPESLTSGQPHQPVCTEWFLDVSSLAVGWTEEQTANVSSFPGTQTSGRDAECTQLTTVENDIVGNPCEDDLLIPTQLALSAKKEKKRMPKEQPKTVTDDSEAGFLKTASIADEHSSADSACFDVAVTETRNKFQNPVRKSSRLRRQRRVKANATATVPEVETYSEPQLPQADAGTLHDNVDKELQPEPARRSLKTCGQQKKQMRNTEESVNQKSKGDSPKQDSCINLMSSQHEFVTRRSATKTNNTDEKLLEPKQTGRKLRPLKQQKKLREKSLNQKAKVCTPKLDLCLSLSSFHASEAHRSDLEASLVGDKHLEPKPTQRSLRTRGQLKKQVEKSVDTKRQRKPDKSSPQQEVSQMSLQQAPETHEPWTANDRTNLQTAFVNSEPFSYTGNGNPEEVFQEHTDKNVAGQLPEEKHSTESRSCSISSDYSVSNMAHVSYESDAASPTVQSIQNTVGDRVEDVGCCQKNSPAISSQSEELIGSSHVESCIFQNEILPSHSLAATQGSAVDNSQCSAVVVNDQEQSTAAAMDSVQDVDSVQDMEEVKHASMKVPEGVYNPADVNGETAISRPGKQKSSVPQCFGLSCGVMTFGHTVMSCPSNVDYCPKTMETHATEAKQRVDRVMASVAVCEVNNEDEKRDGDVDSLNSCPCTDLDVHTDVTCYEVASQNSSVIASQEFSHSLPPVDSLHDGQSYSSKGLVHTVSSGTGTTRVRGISCKASTLNERTYKGEDPMADDSESQQVASQQTHRQKCSVAASEFATCFLSRGYSQSVSSVHQMHQEVLDHAPAVHHISPEVNEIPSTLPQMHSQMAFSNDAQKRVACASREGLTTDHREYSPAQTTASQQQHRRQKCSIVAFEYGCALQAAQALCEAQQQVASMGVSYTTPDMNEIPSSLPHIHSQIQSGTELQKEAACVNRNDSMIDFSEFSQASVSQQHHRHKCSVVASEYSLGSQVVQRLHDTQHEVATTSADHSTAEVNTIPSLLPLTNPQRYSIYSCSSAAPMQTQPTVSFCRQAVDTIRVPAVAERQPCLPDDDTRGNPSSFTFPCQGLHDIDADRVDRVPACSDGGDSVNVSQAGVEQRIKVSEPLLADCRNEMEDDKPAE